MTFQHRTAAVGARFAHATRPIQKLSAPPAAPAMVRAGPAADPEPLPPCFLDTLALDLALAEPTPPAAAPIDARAIFARFNQAAR